MITRSNYDGFLAEALELVEFVEGSIDVDFLVFDVHVDVFDVGDILSFDD